MALHPLNIPGIAATNPPKQDTPPNADDDRDLQNQQQHRTKDEADSDLVFDVNDPDEFMRAVLSGALNSDDDADSSDEEDDDIDESSMTPEQKARKRREAKEAEAAVGVMRAAMDSIDNFALPQDFDLERLDGHDPAARRSALQELGQHAIRQSVSVLVPIIAAAVERQSKMLESSFKEQLTQYQNDTSFKQRMAAAIPEYGDPALRPIADGLFKQLQKAGQSEAAAIKNVAHILRRLPIAAKGGSKKPGGVAQNQGGSQGSASLDDYFG